MAYLAAGLAALAGQALAPWLPWPLNLSRATASFSMAAAQYTMQGQPAVRLGAGVIWLAAAVSFAVSDWIIAVALKHGWWVLRTQAILVFAAGLALAWVAMDSLRAAAGGRPGWLRRVFAGGHLLPAGYMVYLAVGSFAAPTSRGGGLDAIAQWIRLTVAVMSLTTATLFATTWTAQVVRKRMGRLTMR